MNTKENCPAGTEQIRKDTNHNIPTTFLFVKGNELTSHGYTYDQAGGRWADLLDAQDALSTALDALKGITDSPISVEVLSDMHSDVAAEARRMRQVMDDCGRTYIPRLPFIRFVSGGTEAL